MLYTQENHKAVVLADANATAVDGNISCSLCHIHYLHFLRIGMETVFIPRTRMIVIELNDMGNRYAAMRIL